MLTRRRRENIAFLLPQPSVYVVQAMPKVLQGTLLCLLLPWNWTPAYFPCESRSSEFLAMLV